MAHFILSPLSLYFKIFEASQDKDLRQFMNDVEWILMFQLKRDQELAKVAIKKQDVELIMRELEVTKQVAERSLREHMGSLSTTLVALTN